MAHVDNDIKLDFKDVLIRPKGSDIKSSSDVDISRQYDFRNAKRNFPTDAVPIFAANMDTVGTFEMAVVLSQYKMLTCIHKHYTVEEWVKFSKEFPDVIPYVVASCGMNDADEQKIGEILKDVPNINAICLDDANAYSERFLEFLSRTRARFPKQIIMAGNVVTGDMVKQLLWNGADIIKVGIGAGSVFTTRKITGVGYPQVSAVMECADAANGIGHIISDGGCTCPGDVAKAFAAGADCVMLDDTLAAHDDSGGTIQEILDGLRSACMYVGASKLNELSKRTTFIRVTQQSNEVYS